MTRVFPQLNSGALTQFPLRIEESVRTIVNETADGIRVRYADVGAATMTWEISSAALSDAEWWAIESLFNECEGRRRSFLFLDPWSNLLAESESFTASSWTRGPGIGLSEGVTSPTNQLRATQATNTAAGLQSLSQSVPVPAWFQYTFSVYARSSEPTALRLIVSTDGAAAERLFSLSSDWQRLSLFSSMNSANTSIDVALQLPAGAAVDLFGAQLEPQPAPSPYQRTAERTGRYPEARFATDTLNQVTTRPSEHSTVFRIVSRIPA